MKKIIVPVDFSTHSENALKTAAFLAKNTDIEIIVVHMLELSDITINQSEDASQKEFIFHLKFAEKRFAEFLEKEYLSGIKVTPIVKHYKVFSELNEITKEVNADLVVIASKGASGLEEIFIGSNTQKVVRYANAPVLVIKEEPILSKITKAVFACNFSKEDVAYYLKVKMIFEKLGCDLQLIYVNTPTTSFKNTFEISEKIIAFFEEVGESPAKIKEVQVIADYSVEQGVLSYADKSKSDLIVVATHGRKGISRFLEGSISEDIVNHSELPILSFKIE